MKKSLFIILALAIAFFGFSLHAQTTSTVTLTNSTGGTTVVSMPKASTTPTVQVNDLNISNLATNQTTLSLESIAKSGIQWVEGTTNSGVVAIEPYALYNTGTKQFGGGLNLYFPVAGSQTNSLLTLGAGFGVLYMNKQLYDGTLNARVSAGSSLPLFTSIKYEAYIESGAGYNVSKNRAVTQAFAGILFPFQVTPNILVTLGGAIGTISDLTGKDYAVGGSVTWKWGK